MMLAGMVSEVALSQIVVAMVIRVTNLQMEVGGGGAGEDIDPTLLLERL